MAAAHEHLGRMVIERFGMHRLNHADIDRVPGHMWQAIGKPHSTLTVLPVRPLRSHQRRVLVDERKPHALGERIGQLLAIELFERRLGAVQLQVTRSTRP